ncbi:MAG: hypothetical protein SVU32_01880 [Candidatus Nanohaloarchaea archaeon]|nr:hypothetical protein [Candidatus Nanohaloarchaea archaeon]
MSRASDPGTEMPYGSLDELKDELEERSLLDYMVEHTDGDTMVPHKGESIDEDAYLQAVVDIHFDETYGTPYWREQLDELDFDPREEVDSFDDLAKLGEADEEALKERPVEDFMPRLFHSGAADPGDTYETLEPDPSYFDMSKSSGTTGKKKIMPWRKSVSEEIVEWYTHNLDLRGTEDGNWLSMGPYGLYEKHLEGAANEQGGILHFSGVETRKLKKQARHLGKLFENPVKGVKNAWSAFKGFLRMNRGLEVLREDLQSEQVENIASVPQVAKRLYDDLDSEETVSSPGDIETILVSGAAVTEEAVDELEDLYQEADVVPMYATSFTGPAFDHPGTEGIQYHSLEPFMTVEVLEGGEDYATRDEVEYNERGQVAFHRIGEDFFWPNQTERESAVRKEGTSIFESDGVAAIESLED